MEAEVRDGTVRRDAPGCESLADRLRDFRQRRTASVLARPGRRWPAFRPLERATLTPMRTASSSSLRVPNVRLEQLVPPPLAVRVLSRAGYGPRPGDVDAFNALGSSDGARLEAWVEAQLSPAAIDDSDCDARLAAAGLTTLEKSFEQLWAEHYANDPDWYVRLLPAIETERAAFIRAVWSRRQLTEVLAEFWHDHFNVYAWDYIAAPTWVHYDRDVIRAHMLGNFREMLGAVAASPAMLVFLDNWSNTVAGPNENWARELCELHTLGAMNYLGVRRQDEVAVDGDGRPIGYVDGDVYEITRCFTGWTFDDDTGETIFRSDRHDRFQKRVLGAWIPNDQPPFADGRTVLDLLAEHPGTARHLATKLARRLIGDGPPVEVVDAAAAVFHDQREAPDQLRQVVRTILLSDAFRTTWGRKVKRPFEVLAGVLRASGAELGFALDDGSTDSFLWLYERTGHALFSWRPPNGYPDLAEDWLGTGTLVATWRLVNWLVGASDEQDRPLVDVLAQAPADATSANALADYWIERLLARPVSDNLRREIVEFMAQGRNPEVPLHLAGDEGVQDRLRTMVALIVLAPEFMWR